MTEKKVAVHISGSLYDQVKRRVEDSRGEFQSVEEYVEFVLNEVVKEDDEELKQSYSQRDEEEVKKRLKSLGYL